MFYHSANMLKMLIATDIIYKNLNAFHFRKMSVLLYMKITFQRLVKESNIMSKDILYHL
jgi:hypothetical protein